MVTVVPGRETEMAAVHRMLDPRRTGLAALVLEGDPGIGKTTVWRAGIARAEGAKYRVLSCRAAQTEARLAFTALGDLLAPVSSEVFATLPDPQRRALDAALLRADARGAAVDPRAIGTALASLLSQIAAATPVLVAIDDLQWLDVSSARALEFALRRLEAQPVALLATMRTGEEGSLRTPRIDNLEKVRLGPLDLGALHRIIEMRLGLSVPRPQLLKITQSCGGNPFYALEIARVLASTPSALPGQELPIPRDLRGLLAKRLRKLPRRTRDALFKVSALASPAIGAIAAADLVQAEEAGVVSVQPDGRIEFSHPLFASAVHAAAPHARRQRLHAELAEVATDVEERARHLMLSQTAGHCDDRVADVLHDAADHALRRGAVEVAAELDEESARRTSELRIPARWHRFLRAARHYLKAGDPARAKKLCGEVMRASPPPQIRAHGLHILAEAAINENLGAASSLLEEALACVGDDVAHAAQLEISLGMVFGARRELARSVQHLVRAVELAERIQDDALLAEAIALKEVAGLVSGQGFDEGQLRRALALEQVDREVPFQMRTSLNVGTAYLFSGRVDLAREVFLQLKRRVVARGDEGDLAWVLCNLSVAAFLSSDLENAELEADEAERVAALNGMEIFRAHALMLRTMIGAVRGNPVGARSDGAEAIALSERIGWPVGMEQTRWGLGLLALSEGNPSAAATLFDPAIAKAEMRGVFEWPMAMFVPDAIEALVATGGIERATRLTDALAHCGLTFDRPWALATSGRCRALLHAAAGDLESAAAAGDQALVDHARLPMPFELARTLLVHGRVERRRGNRRAAREVLGRALAIFEGMGAPLWAGIARAEIARIGVRRAPKELTEAEEQVAVLAARGLTNVEIAARLFMSRRTVEANLARAYAKLGIRSRAELGAVVALREGRSPL